MMSSERAAGLDEAQIFELLFRAGLSTREEATELSGRGVGLDVVRRQVELMDGVVRVESTPGHGARFVIEVPTAISRERYLVIREDGVLYGLPARTVRSVRPLTPEDVQRVAGGAVLDVNGEKLELASLRECLGARGSRVEELALVLHVAGRAWALAIAEIVSESDVLRRPADPLLGASGLFAGSGLLEDGRLLLLMRPTATLTTGGRFAPAPTRRAESMPRVLVVDDSPVVRDLVSDLLSSAGFVVETAEDGISAWERLERNTPTIVVTDVEMPRLSGLELLERIRQRWPHLPVVMVTTRGSAEDRRAAAELGASAYVAKSEFTPGTLLETVQRFVRLPS
jgi:CheY-like chemotaxis protein